MIRFPAPPGEGLHHSVRAVAARVRAAYRVAFFSNSRAIGGKKRLVTHSDPHHHSLARVTQIIPGACALGRGFTLLEMLVVLVIASIAVAVVGVGGQAFMERSRYHQAVRNISTQLKQARALSVREGRSIGVAYDVNGRQVVVDGKPVLEIPPALMVRWVALNPQKKAPDGAGEPVFVFNADGGARGGSLAVYRAGVGVAFGVNWLLGTVQQTVAAAPS